jgi:hypothetical protein
MPRYTVRARELSNPRITYPAVPVCSLNFKVLAASGEERDGSSAIVVLSALARLAAGKKSANSVNYRALKVMLRSKHSLRAVM